MNKDSLFFGLIVGFAIAGLTLAIVDSFELKIIYAEESQIEFGKNYNDELVSVDSNGKETHRWTPTHERISTDGEFWHDYYFQNNEGTLRFESSVLSFEFYDDTSDFKIWSGGLIDNRSPDIPSFSTTLKTAINGTDDWTNYSLVPSSYSYSDIPYGKQIEFTQNHNDVILKTIYETTTDNGLKWTYEISNISKENSKFGITTVCNNCGELFIDDIGYLDGEWSKEDLLNEDGTYKRLHIKDFPFDTQDYEHDYLWAFKNVNGNIIFDFTYSKGVLEIGDTLTIDPTFTASTVNLDGTVTDDNSDNICNSIGTMTQDDTNTVIWAGSKNTGSIDCHRAFVEWSTSGWSSESIATAINFTFNVNVASDSDERMDIHAIENKPTSASVSNLFDDIKDGVEYVSGSEVVYATGDETLSLGSGAVSDWNTNVRIGGQTWWAVGISGDNENPLDLDRFNICASEGSCTAPSITVTYTVDTTLNPDPVDDLTSTEILQTTIKLDFTEPDLNGWPLINYQINATTPQTANPQTFVMNTTSTSPTITGLSIGTSYSIRVSALTEIGYNATGNVLNVTTLAFWPPDGIDDLTSTEIGASTVTLSFTQPNLNGGNLINYLVNATTPQTVNPQTFAMNTTSTSPTITGLSSETFYSIRVSALSEIGYNVTGNVLNFTTHGIPIITLIGYNPQIIELGLGYTEQGATTDNGSPVIIDSTSFMDIVGDYFIYYDSSNSAGNSTQIIRDVSVYDGYTINFTTGNIDVNATNPLNIDAISYEKISIDDSSLALDNSVIVNVDYPNFYDLNCDIHYKFANTNSNYTSINGTILTTYTNQITFNFTNLSNEVITLYCYDSITGDGSIYVVSNDNFPLLQMIDNFRDGVFGTESKIGYLDGITLLVIIVSMVGFNRRDAKVGIILNIMIMGVAGYYEIIQVETIMFGALATVAMFAIFSARKRQ